nr:complex I NDUFA9 subunit family protein [Pseudomonadota bacterium]
DFQRIHVDTAERIARAVHQAGVPALIHISALGANTQAKAQYARTKALGEQAVRKAFPQASIIRPSIVFGPEDRLFNLFAGLARLSPVLPLVGGGKTRFQPVYVDDVAQAIARLATGQAPGGETLEAVGPKVYTFRELMVLMLKEIRRRRLLVPVPFCLAKFKAWFLEFLPRPLLTRDQVEMLKTDVVATSGARTLQDLGIQPRAVEAIIPTYLARFRPGGS